MPGFRRTDPGARESPLPTHVALRSASVSHSRKDQTCTPWRLPWHQPRLTPCSPAPLLPQ